MKTVRCSEHSMAKRQLAFQTFRKSPTMTIASVAQLLRKTYGGSLDSGMLRRIKTYAEDPAKTETDLGDKVLSYGNAGTYAKQRQCVTAIHMKSMEKRKAIFDAFRANPNLTVTDATAQLKTQFGSSLDMGMLCLLKRYAADPKKTEANLADKELTHNTPSRRPEAQRAAHKKQIKYEAVPVVTLAEIQNAAQHTTILPNSARQDLVHLREKLHELGYAKITMDLLVGDVELLPAARAVQIKL